MRYSNFFSKNTFFIFIVVYLFESAVCQINRAEEEDVKDARFTLFNIVRFENAQCTGSNGFLGTCFKQEECIRHGGSPQGACALGFGVCCYFESGCGSSTGLNSSYFVGPSTLGTGLGNCQYTINKAGPNVCQIRLDFEDFNLARPNPATGECAIDKMTVTGIFSGTPTICGSNTGQHIYLNTGSSNIPATVTISATNNFPGRRWRIRSTQLPCDGALNAPDGCLQYFTGSSGTIQSFNYIPNNGGIHLNNQQYSICIRTEQGFCSICYSQCTAPATGSFSIFHGTQADRLQSLVDGAACPNDYLMIPCGQANTNPLAACAPNTFCGGSLNVAAAMMMAPVCSVVRPFRLVFRTNADETNDFNSAGFCINYIQNPC